MDSTKNDVINSTNNIDIEKQKKEAMKNEKRELEKDLANMNKNKAKKRVEERVGINGITNKHASKVKKPSKHIIAKTAIVSLLSAKAIHKHVTMKKMEKLQSQIRKADMDLSMTTPGSLSNYAAKIESYKLKEKMAKKEKKIRKQHKCGPNSFMKIGMSMANIAKTQMMQNMTGGSVGNVSGVNRRDITRVNAVDMMDNSVAHDKHFDRSNDVVVSNMSNSGQTVEPEL